MKLFLRFLEDLGFLYVVLGTAILMPVLLLLAGIIKLKYGAFLLFFLQLSVISGLHSERKDKNFLNKLFPKLYKLFSIEYLIVSVPFIILISFTKYWYLSAVVVAACVLIPFFNISYGKRKLHLKNIPLIPDSAFEWKSGLRRSYILFLLVWVAGAGLSFLIGAVPVAIILLNLFTVAFYAESESKTLLEVFALPPGAFIKFKIVQALKLFWIIAAPLVLLFLIFHLLYWYVMAYIVFAASMLIVFAVLQKYAFFEENKTAASRNALLVLLAAVAFYVPHFLFFLPVTLLLCYRFYKKSLTNLSPYLYAYHK